MSVLSDKYLLNFQKDMLIKMLSIGYAGDSNGVAIEIFCN